MSIEGRDALVSIQCGFVLHNQHVVHLTSTQIFQELSQPLQATGEESGEVFLRAAVIADAKWPIQRHKEDV